MMTLFIECSLGLCTQLWSSINNWIVNEILLFLFAFSFISLYGLPCIWLTIKSTDLNYVIKTVNRIVCIYRKGVNTKYVHFSLFANIVMDVCARAYVRSTNNNNNKKPFLLISINQFMRSQCSKWRQHTH